MTIREMSEKLSLEIACEGDDLEREVTKVYCCDLLSIWSATPRCCKRPKPRA